MSSNRNIGTCDAVISESPTKTQNQASASNPTPTKTRNTGPVRLPLIAPEAFVEQFNQIYGSIGMWLTPVQQIADEAQQTSGSATSSR